MRRTEPRLDSRPEPRVQPRFLLARWMGGAALGAMAMYLLAPARGAVRPGEAPAAQSDITRRAILEPLRQLSAQLDGHFRAPLAALPDYETQPRRAAPAPRRHLPGPLGIAGMLGVLAAGWLARGLRLQAGPARRPPPGPEYARRAAANPAASNHAPAPGAFLH